MLKRNIFRITMLHKCVFDSDTGSHSRSCTAAASSHSQSGCALPGRVLPILCSLALHSLFVAPAVLFLPLLCLCADVPWSRPSSKRVGHHLPRGVGWCVVLSVSRAGMWLSCSLSLRVISALDAPFALWRSLSDVTSSNVCKGHYSSELWHHSFGGCCAFLLLLQWQRYPRVLLLVSHFSSQAFSF